MANKISVIIDVAVDRANQSLGSFKKSIQDADGAAGKFKAGVGGAFDAVKANAGNLALAAAAMAVTIGTKAVGAFQDLALEAGRMSQALGLPVEEMSRLIEVAGDLGIESGTLEAALGKMNQTAGKTPAAFEAIGAEIVKTKTGATDVKATFLETVDALNRIEDPAKRAAAAQQIFGRSWRDSAELIGLSSKQIADAMALVDDSKVIDDEEVRKAREFRDALEELRDRVDKVMMALGERLVPALSDAADAFTTVYEAGEKLGDILPDMPGWVDGLAEAAEMVINPLGALSGQIDKLNQTIDPHAVGNLGESITDYTPAVEDATDATDEGAEAIDGMAEAAKRGTQQIKDAIAAYEEAEEAQRGLGSASLEYRQQVSDTANAVAAATLIQADAKRTDEEREQAARDAEAAVYAQADAAVAYAEEQAAANSKQLTTNETTAIYIDELYRLAGTLSGPARQAILNHIALLQGIPTSINTNVNTNYTRAGGIQSSSPNVRGASGGIVTRPTMALIGEAGPEAVVPLNSTPGSSPLGGMGGNTYNITISGLTGPQVADELVNKIKEYERRNGGLPW